MGPAASYLQTRGPPATYPHFPTSFTDHSLPIIVNGWQLAACPAGGQMHTLAHLGTTHSSQQLADKQQPKAHS